MKSDLSHCRLYLLLTRKLCRLDPLETVAQAMDGGVDLVQVREKPILPADRDWLQQVRELCKRARVPLFINDSKDLAGTDPSFGLHLGQEDLAAYAPGLLRQRDFSLGISTHSTFDLDRALLEEPDYVGLGPCFPTTTKGYQDALSAERIRQVVLASPVPVFAIGGITPERVDLLLDKGLRRFAVSSTILDTDDPKTASEALRSRIEQLPLG